MGNFLYASFKKGKYCYGSNMVGKYGKVPDSECDQDCYPVSLIQKCGNVDGTRSTVFKF